MPYIGDGDLATQFYKERQVYGADLDSARVEIAQGRFPFSDIRIHDVEQWPFPDVQATFSVADFDAYGNPYKSFMAFWEQAHKTFPLVCFFTDGLRLRIMRGNVVYDFHQQRMVAAPISEARKQNNFWLKRHVIPWMKEVTGAEIGLVKFGMRQHMVYWGCVIVKQD